MVFNPFENIATISNDKLIAETFVKDAYVISSFASARHSFIWGVRGAGKSTLLKYFEPYCQTNQYKNWKEYIKHDKCFIAIYSPIVRGMIDESKFAKLDDYIREILPKHLLNMIVSKQIIKTFKEICSNKNTITPTCDERESIKEFLFIIGANEAMKNEIDSNLSFLDFVDEFLDREIRRINTYIQRSPKINMIFECCITDYHEYILPLVQLMKKTYILDCPFYFMFDDAGYASSNIKKYLNTWIANRDNNDIVVKIASNPLFYSNFEAEDGYSIEKTHDYIEIHLDYIKSGDKPVFKKNVIEIAKKRLSNCGMKQLDPELLFPCDDDHMKLLKEAQTNAIKLLDENSGINDVNRFINRNTISELHKLLAKNKKTRSYAGLENIINLSSGNYRNFLRLADSILKYIMNDEKRLEDIECISPIEQQKAILDFSEAEFNKIRDYRTDIKKEVFEGAYTLIDSMGEVFKFRLKEGQFQECAITAFSIKDYRNIDELGKEIIQYTLVNGFFIRNSVRSKRGTGRNEIYQLNKLFVPTFNLEPTPFSGYITFSSDEIKLAMIDKDLFLSKYKSKNKTNSNNIYQYEFSDYIEE